jgi:UDP-N-acetylglucosamine:LPS N-acetylglucosamine transferase
MGAVLGLLWATAASVASFVLRRPRVVVVVGGYASLPAGLAAVLTRAPVVLMNTDAVPGAVNAMLGRFAAASAVAFPGTDLPRAHLTGTPVRPELGSLDRTREGRQAARRRLGLPLDRQTLTVFGGSLGARRINVAAADLARRWSDRGELTLYQVTGRRDYAQFAPSEPGAEPGPGAERSPGEVLRTDTAHLELRYEVVPYEEHMAEFYGAADVCVCRSGALTVAELLVCGVPAILVPLPGAPRDHQTRNAQALVAAGAAVMVPDEECDADRLASELTALLSDTDRLRAMSAAARALGHADAAARVAELVDAHAR